MDITSLMGIALAMLTLFGGMQLEINSSLELFDINALFIIISGTFAGLILQSNTELFINSVRLLKWVFFPPKREHQKFIHLIVDWSVTSRRSGISSLEPFIEDLEDTFQARALQMLVNGIDPAVIEKSLNLEIEAYQRRIENYVKVWEFAGKYALWSGLLGTMILGWGRGGIFNSAHVISLIYGIALSYLIFIPIANRLRYLNQEQILLKQMLVDGIVSIGNGENPKTIESKLASYLP